MVEVWFPGWYFPGFTIRKGSLLDVYILAVHVQIPPFDITFWEGFWVWRRFRVFDSDWVVRPVVEFISDPGGFIARRFSGLYADVSNLLDALKLDVLGPALKPIDTLLDNLGIAIEGWIGDVKTRLGRAEENIVGVITDPGGAIKAWIDSAADLTIGRVTRQIEGWLRDKRGPLAWIIDAVAGAVWAMFRSTLDEMAEDYYRRHPKEGS